MSSNLYLNLSKLRNVFTKRSLCYIWVQKSHYMIFSCFPRWVCTVCTAPNCLYSFGTFLRNDKGELLDSLFSSQTTNLILTVKDEQHQQT